MTSSRATRGIWCTSCEPCSHSTHRRRPSGGRGWRRTRAVASLSGRRAGAGAASPSGNALRYVVVYVSSGDQPAPPPAEAVRYDQKGCQYIPHVAVLDVNQPLDIYNDDQTSHNIHPLAKQNPEWNKSQPIGAPPIHTK